MKLSSLKIFVKIRRTLSIQGNMTHLISTRTVTPVACLLLAIGCASRVDVANEGTGGVTLATGGKTSAIGGTGPFGTTPIGTGTGGHTVTLDTGSVGTSIGGHTVTLDTGSIGTSIGGHTATLDTLPVGTSTGGTTEPLSTLPIGTSTGGADYGNGTSIKGICTPGADQTCNDDVTMSTIAGHCEADGSCTCGNGYFSTSSGKCTTYEQTVCYSPTQNINLAYVQRAFGCHCDTLRSPPYCGIDSDGLRVYLACTNGAWQSGDTRNCNGSDPLSCYSPTQNTGDALSANAIGCTCNSGTASPVCVEGPLDAGSDMMTDAAADAPLTMKCVNGRWQANDGCS